ncbi:MAG: mechanosensitive ion channel family protein [Bacteroidetes bacterium]|nr:mechanosensitive ion channel family protein [Bacteroidota bacterium]
MNILEFFLGKTLLSVLLSTLLLIVLGYVAGRALKVVLRLFSDKITKKTRSALDDLIVNTLAQYITPVLTIFVMYWSISWAAMALDDSISLLKQGLTIVVEGLYVVSVLYACYFITRLIDAAVRWYLHEVATRTQTHLDDELAPLANRVLKILIYIVGVVIILDHFQQNISTLVVSLGVGSLAIALAAQETLANMIAGFVLMIDRPFRIGDRICLPDGTIGLVREIGIRSTKVIDDYQVMVITPNAEIVKSQIKNFSYPNDIVRFEVPFGVAYGTDLNAMRNIILERINREGDVVEPETSEVRITEMADSSMNAKLLCKIRNPNNIPRRKSDLLLIMYNTLYEHRIEIPFPQRVLHLAPEAREALERSFREEEKPKGPYEKPV